MTSIEDWLNNLCQRLHHLLQVRFSKHFHYDLELAKQATHNSVLMLVQGFPDHLYPLHRERWEVCAQAQINNNDESALQEIVDGLANCSEHRRILHEHHIIGAGFAYDPRLDRLYACARLR